MQKLNRLLYLLAVIKFHRDELLYLAAGAHPAFGFMEVPTLLSVFAWITLHLGNSISWIKCWPSLVGALNLILMPSPWYSEYISSS